MIKLKSLNVLKQSNRSDGTTEDIKKLVIGLLISSFCVSKGGAMNYQNFYSRLKALQKKQMITSEIVFVNTTDFENEEEFEEYISRVSEQNKKDNKNTIFFVDSDNILD